MTQCLKNISAKTFKTSNFLHLLYRKQLNHLLSISMCFVTTALFQFRQERHATHLANFSSWPFCLYLPHNFFRSRSEIFFKSVWCPNDDSILDCLRKVPVDTITEYEWMTNTFFTLPWVPSKDGKFINDTPHNLVKVLAEGSNLWFCITFHNNPMWFCLI